MSKLTVPPLPYEQTYRFAHIMWLGQSAQQVIPARLAVCRTGRCVAKSASQRRYTYLRFDTIFASLDSSQL